MAACGIAPEEDDGNHATKTAPVAAPKPVAKPATPPAPPAPPKKMEGHDREWQLKVSAEPDTEWENWLAVVVEATVTALDSASNLDDIMNIWRTNANIYKQIEMQDNVAYRELVDTFGTYKGAFKDDK